MNWLLSVLIALDQLVNAIIGGYPDETLSASAWKGEQDGKLLAKFFRPIIDAIFSIVEKDHCYNAYLSEIKGSQRPPSYREKYNATSKTNN